VIERQDEIRELGGEVLLVAFDDLSLLQAKMLSEIELPYPLLIDGSRETYGAWGMGRTNLFGAMLSPELNWRYLKLLAKGERFLGFAPDMLQLGGDFIVGRDGVLKFAYRMRNNGDRASTDTLVGAMAEE
jgi:hypothetical protein